MARVQTLTDGITQEKYFREPVTGMTFRAITAGLCWPSEEKSGCAVVLGETRSAQNAIGIDRRDVHILEERQADDPADILEWLERMTDDWLIRLWATPMTDKRVFMLDDVNIQRKKMRRPKLKYAEPRGWAGKGEGLLPFYHALVQRRTMSEKTLFFGSRSLCADEIARLPLSANMILEYPSMAALCFALAEIDVERCVGRQKTDADLCGPADLYGGY